MKKNVISIIIFSILTVVVWGLLFYKAESSFIDYYGADYLQEIYQRDYSIWKFLIQLGTIAAIGLFISVAVTVFKIKRRWIVILLIILGITTVFFRFNYFSNYPTDSRLDEIGEIDTGGKSFRQMNKELMQKIEKNEDEFHQKMYDEMNNEELSTETEIKTIKYTFVELKVNQLDRAYFKKENITVLTKIVEIPENELTEELEYRIKDKVSQDYLEKNSMKHPKIIKRKFLKFDSYIEASKAQENYE